jgi:TP901 family phage tail tape measure protein
MAESRIDVVVRGEDQLSPELSKIESKIIRTVGAISAALAAVQVITFPIDSVREFEREMANVKKTTEFSAGAMKQLGKDILELSTHTDVSAVDLAKIAAAAGQQGLGGQGREGILQFTESVARMASVLDVTAQQAGVQVGKIMNIFKLPLQQVENAVSAFNEVSNNSTASGEELLDVVKRIGDAASNLKLDQALGLAGAGIDFGFSPEVVGTSVTKIFSDMKAQASEFARLMGTTSKAWVDRVETDGVQAFKDYVARLRTLEGVSRQQVIQKFSGDGRIGAFVTKAVNDVTNAVLDKSLQNAKNGMLSGNSALKEQQTVLQTLDAQLKILGNTVKALAIGVGDETLEPLTRTVAQLVAGLKSPEFKSFAIALGQSFADLTLGAAAVVKWIAALNVNWENLIQLATIFVGIKFGQILLGIAGNASGLSGWLKSISANAKQAAADVDKVGKASVAASAGGGGVAGASKVFFSGGAISEAKKANDELKELRDRQAQAQAAYQKALADEAAALAKVKQQRDAINTVRPATDSSTKNLAAQSKALTDAQDKANDAVVNLIKARNAKALALDTAYQADVKAINAKWQADLSAARATGDRKQVIATNAHYKQLLADTEAAALKQVAVVDRTYKGMITKQEARNAQMLAQEKALYVQLAGVQSAALNTRGTAIAAGAAGSAALATAATNAQNAKKALDDAAAASARASKGFFNFGNAVSFLGLVFSRLTTFVFRAFGIFGLLYTVVDALGGLSWVGKVFEYLGEVIGFSTKEKQKAATASRELKEAQEAEAQRVKDLIAKYEKLKSLDTGKIDFAKIQENLGKGATQEIRNDALNQLLDAVVGADAKLKQFDEKAQEREREKVAKTKQANQQLIAEYEKLGNTITALQKEADNPSVTGDTLTTLRMLESAKRKHEEIGEKIKGNNEKIQQGNGFLAVARATYDRIQEDAATAGALLVKSFTADSFKTFEELGPKVATVRTQMEDLTKSRAKLQTELDGVKGTPAADAVQAKLDQLDVVSNTLSGHMAVLQKEWGEIVADFKKDSRVSPETISSLNLIAEILFGAKSSAKEIFKQLDATGDIINRALASPDGSAAGIPVKPAKGEKTFDVKNKGDSEARKLAKAEIALAHAQAEAAIKLEREKNEQLLHADEDLFRRGLRGITEFYAERERIQLAGITFDISAKERELAVVQDEIDHAKEKSTKVRFEADKAKILGDINVLNAKRKAVIDSNERDARNSTKEFNQAVLQARNDLVQELILPAAAGDVQNVLNQNLLAIDDFYNKLITEAKANKNQDFANLAEWLKLKARIDAVKNSLVPLKANVEDANRALGMMGDRLASLATAGVISNRQLEVEMKRRTQEAIVFTTQQIDAMERQLQGVDSTSGAYRRMQLEIEEAKNQVLRLASEMDRTALAFNQGIAQGLGDSFREVIDGTESSLNRMIANFGKRARSVFADIVSKDLANSALQSLGLTGSGGFGGLLSKGLDFVLGRGRGQDAASQATSGIAGLFKADGSETSPFYVIIKKGKADGGEGGEGSGIGASLLGGDKSFNAGGFFDRLDNSIGKAIDPVTGTGGVEGLSKNLLTDTPVKGIFMEAQKEGGFLDSMSGVFDNFLKGMDGSFSGFGDALSGAFKGLTGLFSGSGGSGGLSSLLALMFHTGGVVGAGGGTARFTSPTIFQHARRHHTGGLAGLRAGEVPAILNKGEEILTRRDPRHVNNGGAEPMRGGMASQFNLTVDPAAINMTLREWLEGELARINANR